MSVAYKPLADRVMAVRETTQPTRTASGIYVAQSDTAKTQFATVAAVGKDVKEVKVGDRVAYDGFQKELMLEGKEFIIIKEEDILVIAQ